MFKIRRKSLGPAYVRSPAQKVEEWMFDNSLKFAFSAVLSLIWIFAGIFVLMAVVKILGEAGGVWKEDLPVAELLRRPWVWPIRVGGVVLIFWYVFKDKFNSR